MTSHRIARDLRILFVGFSFVFALLLTAGPAFAQDDPYVSDTGTKTDDSGSGNQVFGNSVTRSDAASTGPLAFTGAETIALAVIGAGLVVGGGAFVMASRRKESFTV